MTIASIMGLVMTYTALLCSTFNSPLVTSITGNAKDIVATVVGALLFGDFVPTAFNVSGISLSFLGAALFSYAKLKEGGALLGVPKVSDSEGADVEKGASASGSGSGGGGGGRSGGEEPSSDSIEEGERDPLVGGSDAAAAASPRELPPHTPAGRVPGIAHQRTAL